MTPTDIRGGRHVVRTILILAAGLGALLAATAAQAAPEVTLSVQAPGEGGQGPLVAFYILSFLTVLGAAATVTRRNPVVAVVCLVWTLFVSAGIYLLLHATFLAVIQVLVYAGAIMVLFVIVVMAVEHPEREELGFWRDTGTKVLALLGVGYLLFRLIAVLSSYAWPEMRPVAESFGQVSTVGRLLFSDYLFPFEAISILLLVAIVGAVVVSRRRARTEQPQATEDAR